MDVVALKLGRCVSGLEVDFRGVFHAERSSICGTQRQGLTALTRESPAACIETISLDMLESVTEIWFVRYLRRVIENIQGVPKRSQNLCVDEVEKP
jgi:hypothetical protein